MSPQFELFPEQNFETDVSRDECLRAVKKFYEIIRNHTHAHAREAWNQMIGILTQSKRLFRPIPPGCTLERYSSLCDNLRQEIEDVMFILHAGPPADYFGEILEEQESMNQHLGQVLTPEHVVTLMTRLVGIDEGWSKRAPVDEMITAADCACGTGRFSLLSLIEREKNIRFFSNDVDIDLVRAAMLTHWIYFPMENTIGRDNKFWFFLRANSLSRFLTMDSPDWFFANKWDQPGWLLEVDDKRGYRKEQAEEILAAAKGE